MRGRAWAFADEHAANGCDGDEHPDIAGSTANTNTDADAGGP
jgi:hypothetical protein